MYEKLSAEQQQFASMLANYPRFAPYWNFEKAECDEQELRDALGAMSSSEQHMARFFLSLWTGVPAGFDLTDAVSVVEVKDRQLLVEWICKPFWP